MKHLTRWGERYCKEYKEYIQKLERRIHNQRIALHQNWQIIEERANHRNTPLRSMWFDLVKKLVAENKELRKKLDGHTAADMV